MTNIYLRCAVNLDISYQLSFFFFTNIKKDIIVTKKITQHKNHDSRMRLHIGYFGMATKSVSYFHPESYKLLSQCDYRCLSFKL